MASRSLWQRRTASIFLPTSAKGQAKGMKLLMVCKAGLAVQEAFLQSPKGQFGLRVQEGDKRHKVSE
jgi:hypothetical protein